MTSLEFIEKEIKQLEKRKENAFKNEYYSVYKECSQKITALQQIKSELEAWGVVKKTIKPVLKMDKEDYQPVYYWWIAEEIINLDTLDYQILKKALEEKHE